MAETKTTRKDLFVRIAETMANDPEVVEMCNKYIEQLTKPRKKKVNETFLALCGAIANHMQNGEAYTNKELVEWANSNLGEGEDKISSQKMAAVMRHLAGVGTVVKETGEKASDPAQYRLAQ